ncbi:hypothetical protein IGI04_016216 [Brassica rapa subsp. trilocularis]|uniref:Reverse transcriptase zinc-binding domain-containing protein n=1 Tax=Brassica rapa subsp. trilocularis TaxID=1813537 RepID=A0ABQ7MVR0_BRACM|nr:hypothetical protein IGI04_016216 [Brassica rapa subsp. trilocularis]
MKIVNPTTGSHNLRGILVGRDNDPWLFPNSPLRPTPRTLTNKNMRVSDLVDSISNFWNLTATKLHLPQYEDQIRLIILNSFNMQDELVWLVLKSETYSTKSVGSNLAAKGLYGDFRCKRCGQEKTDLLLFLQCPFANHIWNLVPALYTPPAQHIDSIT